MSFILSEKGGDEFLTPAGEYIDKIIKINKSKIKSRARRPRRAVKYKISHKGEKKNYE